MERKLLDETASAVVELKSSAALSGPFGRFERNKPRHIQDRKAIAFCLAKPGFRVIQHDAAGDVVADTDDQKSDAKSKPKSYTRRDTNKQDDFAPVELQDARREDAKREAAERQLKLEREWLEEERKAAERKGVETPHVLVEPAVDTQPSATEWSPAMSRSELASILCEALADDKAADGLKKAEIIEALESLG